MSSPPYIPLYIADYLADTQHFSAAEHGAYLLLIMAYWRDGGLPADEKRLARIACMTTAEWKRSASVIMPMFGPNKWGLIHADSVAGIHRFDVRTAIPVDIRNAVLERDGQACRYCGGAGPFEFDHVFPWVRGGKHSIENIVIACKPCNRSKGAKMVEEWLQ